MNLSAILSLLLDDPAASTKTVLRFLHFVGLAVGLGGATLLDLMLLRFFVRRQVCVEHVEIFEFSSKIINAGLKLLWLTGLGFLLHYSLCDPIKLQNPKLHAKLAVVVILTLNGVFIHMTVLPHLRRQIGRTLFHGTGGLQRSVFFASGAVSAVSWYTPVVLGVFSQLNFSVPATQILVGYLVLVAFAAACMAAVVGLLSRTPEDVDVSRKAH